MSQKGDQNIKHVELSIAAHRMRFLGIAARLEPTIAGVQHRSVWPGLVLRCVCFFLACVGSEICIRNTLISFLSDVMNLYTGIVQL